MFKFFKKRIRVGDIVSTKGGYPFDPALGKITYSDGIFGYSPRYVRVSLLPEYTPQRHYDINRDTRSWLYKANEVTKFYNSEQERLNRKYGYGI